MRRAALAWGAVVMLAAAGAGAQPAPDPGGGSAGSAGSAGLAGSAAGSGSGSGSGGPRVIQLPTDIAAPQVTAAASPTQVALGSKLTVFIKATFGDGVEVNLREPIDLGSVFEVTRKVSEDRRGPDGRTTREWQLEVIAWELGDLVMPPITVTYTAFGRAGQVQTNAIKLKVNGALGDVVDDPKAIRDHAPPKELLRRDWFWVWIASGAGALISGGAALLAWRSRRRRRTVQLVAGVVAAPRRMDPASARALEKLLAIERSGVLDRDEVRKAGYTEMVEVIREYIATRYRVELTDLTTSELLRRLERAAPDEERGLVEAWLERCDIVKYGGLRTTREDARTTLDDARALVVTTAEMPNASRGDRGEASVPRTEAV
ncbi:MAG TPA: BatD family protein [Kofleriaceae bacterium]|nr:BatD family protein [Kofleriaceae bacterium]